MKDCFRGEEDEIREAGAGLNEAMGSEGGAFRVEVGLPPGSFIARHVDNEFDAVEADSLCTLDGAGEEYAEDDLYGKGAVRRRLHVHGYRLGVRHLGW